MDKIKVMCSGVFGVIMGFLGALAVPVILLVLCNIIDYVTGLAASKYRGQQISSYKGIRGIQKKICMWLLICVGAIVDQLIVYACAQASLIVPFEFAIACVVAIWLICNEVISILENIKDIGVNLPPFLNKLMVNIKSQIEEKTNNEVEGMNNGKAEVND